MVYDILVIGSGPAGLTAAIYAARASKKVLVIEKEAFGGLITHSPKVENYPGYSVISGLDLADKFVAHAMDLQVQFEFDDVLQIIKNEDKTFTLKCENNEFIGGVIAPGIKGSLDSLVNGTAKLPRVEIEAPKSAIAKNTVTNMQAGIVFGFAGLVEHLVKRIKKELKAPIVKTIATGGFSNVISKEIECIDVVDKLLTLKGLKYLYDLNTKQD